MTAVTLDYSWLGTITSSYDVHIDAASVAAFAAATNDSVTSFAPGASVPPVFGVVPTRNAVLTAIRAAVPVEISAAVAVLHGEHEMTWDRPLRAGETVRVSGSPVGVQQKGSGTLLLVRIDTTEQTGQPIGRQHLTVFLPGWTGEHDAGEPLPPLDAVPVVEPQTTVAVPTTPDQSRRYGVASGDTTAFHMDDEAARRYGFDGVIMHGLCSLAISVNALAGELRRPAVDVRRLTARFTSPAQPGDELVSTYWTAASGTVGFSTRAPDGRSVLDRGSIDFFHAVAEA